MSRPWILVAPSSRGIGLALTTHLLRTTTAPIIATSRTDCPGLKARLLATSPTTPSSRLHVVPLDVTVESTVQAAASHAAHLFPQQTHHLHLAFAMPGILSVEKSTRQIDLDAAGRTMAVNALGPLVLMKWFADFLPRKQTVLELNGHPELPAHAVWLSMSARVGSISDNKLGGWFSYRASKAAVNSLTKTLDHQLMARCGGKAIAVAYHPGTVKTDFSREFWGNVEREKLFEPEDAVRKMMDVVTRKVGLEGKRGRCWDWKGEEIPP